MGYLVVRIKLKYEQIIDFEQSQYKDIDSSKKK